MLNFDRLVLITLILKLSSSSPHHLNLLDEMTYETKPTIIILSTQILITHKRGNCFNFDLGTFTFSRKSPA